MELEQKSPNGNPNFKKHKASLFDVVMNLSVFKRRKKNDKTLSNTSK